MLAFQSCMSLQGKERERKEVYGVEAVLVCVVCVCVCVCVCLLLAL